MPAHVNTKIGTRNSERGTGNPKLPFVFINMAITADGKIATANRSVSSFGSKRDKEHLFELRATADAVMCGAGTVNSGPVNLGPGSAKFRRMRTRAGLAEYNLRIVTSGSGGVDPNAEIFKQTFSPIIILTTGRASEDKLKTLREVATEIKILGPREINFRTALQWLREKWKVKRLLCEGGGELNDALFRAGLVNELHLTICPKIFGGRRAPTIAEGIGVSELANAAQFKLKSMKRIGDELFVVYECLSSTHRAKSQSKSARRLR
jgi:2,5-diamino-6-(ribosylamino)-4(3H)-pyrimidinone 5'-phosphate reductase